MKDSAARREQHNQEFFDDWAKRYDGFRISPWFRYTQSLALSEFPWRDDGVLLDIGCGTGQAVLEAARRLPNGRACGVDISEGMLERAGANVPAELADRIEFRLAGAESMPYDTATFDYVLCTNSFHHYDSPARALAEMRRVLKVGGTLAIFENAPDLSLYTWMWDRFLRIFEKGHVRYYPSRELGEMIRRAEFAPVRLAAFRNEILKHGKLFASIQLWVGNKPDVGSK